MSLCLKGVFKAFLKIHSAILSLSLGVFRVLIYLVSWSSAPFHCLLVGYVKGFQESILRSWWCLYSFLSGCSNMTTCISNLAHEQHSTPAEGLLRPPSLPRVLNVTALSVSATRVLLHLGGCCSFLQISNLISEIPDKGSLFAGFHLPGLCFPFLWFPSSSPAQSLCLERVLRSFSRCRRCNSTFSPFSADTLPASFLNDIFARYRCRISRRWVFFPPSLKSFHFFLIF